MFCPNCGTELVKLNQKFCQTCGINLSLILNRGQNAAIAKSQPTPINFKTPQLRTERVQDAAIAKSQLTPVYTSFPVSQQMLVKKREVGSYSKKCLAFSIVSFAIGIFCVFSGGAILILINISRYAFVGLIGFIVSILANSVGVIFGILSRLNNTKAGKSETSNSVKTIGSVFGILGLSFNIIELGLALTIIGIVIAVASL